ncbi:MAG: tetratricopeptide repeat protein [Bacteroidetes bacterium]|nr:tetratricopeptide repeat protein [Bacteroidota bacterium]
MDNINDVSDLLNQLENTEGTEKIDVLNKLAVSHFNIDVIKAVNFSFQAKTLSEELNDKERLAKSLLLLGKGYYRIPDFLSAIDHLSTSAFIAEEIENIPAQIEALTALGMSLNFAGDFSRALDSQYKALNLCVQTANKSGESECLMQIGLSYLGNKENDMALEFLNKALQIRLKSGTKMELASVLGNLGNIHINLEKHEKALEYFEQCKALFEELGNKVQTGRAYMNMGISYGALGRYEEAVDYVNTGLKAFLLVSDKEPVCKCIYTLGYIFAEQKNYEKAIQYYDEAIIIGEEYKLIHTLEHIYGAKSDAAAKLEDYKTAYEYYIKSHSMVEDRLKKTSDFKTRYLNVAHKVDKLQEESAILSERNAKLKELNDRLTLLNNEKSEFLGIAAHDLKNPLSSISLSASTLKKYLDTLPHEKIISHLERIENTSTKMKNIVTNLINMNIIETGEYKIKKEELNLSALISYIIDDFQHRAVEKNIQIIFNEPKEIKITTDENAIYSILDNLISNAIKYSHPNSSVYLNLEKKDNIIIKIKDNGLGIQESEKDKVFQKFSRISNKPTGGENSTGLGLSIVKKLTELIGGNINFESEYGKGTTFTLELPR